MRIFVFEHLSAGTTAADGPLRDQGWDMLRAVLADLARCPGVEPIALVAAPLVPAVAAISTGIQTWVAVQEPDTRFRRLAAEADFTLVIAPESDDLLFAYCRAVVESGGRLLGPSPEAVRRVADKLALAQLLREHGIPTAPAAPMGATAFPFPLVVKPRQGAGSQATFLVRTRQELVACPDRARSEGFAGALIQQPYVAGLAASVALLVGGIGAFALPAAEQVLSPDGRFRYCGGRLPLPADLDRRARSLAERAVRAVPGLHGFVGVDLVLGDADVVIEINPRLTMSYVGLRRLARFNLAEALLAVACGQRPPAWDWRANEVVFRSRHTIDDSSRT